MKNLQVVYRGGLGRASLYSSRPVAGVSYFQTPTGDPLVIPQVLASHTGQAIAIHVGNAVQERENGP